MGGPYCGKGSCKISKLPVKDLQRNNAKVQKRSEVFKKEYTNGPRYKLFNETNKSKIMINSTKNSQVRTYFFDQMHN